MTDYLLIFISNILLNNLVLVKFLGICPFIGISKRLETAINMGLATTFIITKVSLFVWLIDRLILVPMRLTYLRTITFILVIAVIVQFTEIVMRKTSPIIYRMLGIFLPLITTNCIILGIVLINANLEHNFLQSILYSFSSAVGFLIVIILFSSINERLSAANIPLPFRGKAIALITAGLMSLIFMGFNGLIKYQ